MAPPAHFRLPSLSLPQPAPPRRRSSSTSGAPGAGAPGTSTLHLARSGGGASASASGSRPPSIASEDADERAAPGAPRKHSLQLTPITPTSPAAPGPPKSDAGARASTDSVDSPRNTAEWAAAHAAVGQRTSLSRPRSSYGDESTHPRLAAAEGRRTVQFASDAAVARYSYTSYEDEDEGEDGGELRALRVEMEDTDGEAGEAGVAEFERPTGNEMLAVVLSFSAVLVLAISAALTTVYDFVL